MMTFEDYKHTQECFDIYEKLKRQLKNRGFDISNELKEAIVELKINVSEDDFYDEIENAIEAVNDRRHFISNDQKLFEDKYKGIVVRLAICSFAKMGAEGQLAHSENKVSRTYAGASEFPNDILKEIVPLGRMKSI